MFATPAQVIARLRKAWQPPEDLKLSEWAEKNVILPEEHKARPGEYRNWPYMREIMDVIGDTQHERVSIIKSARIGYTKSLVIAMGAICATEPTQVMLLMPTDEDAAEISVDEVEPLFETTPILKGLIKKGNSGHSNMRNKQILGGGSIKIRSARAPRKLRRLDVRVLLIDEADAIEVTKEGDAIAIAEKRTLAKAQRKIVVGSTPTEEGISVVERLFDQGDQRIFEVPCPHKDCGVFNEIRWEAMEYTWDETGHNVASCSWRCPECHQLVPERYKPQMIQNGSWRALRPEVKDHASFRINALSSLLPQATWLKIAKEWVIADRGGPSTRQVFVNTILGRPWRVTLHRVDVATLMQRVEPWGLASEERAKPRIPDECLGITAGTDVQPDRLEVTLLGWTVEKQALALGHVVFEGNTLQPEVWKKLDQWHATSSWLHPNGWRMGIDAMAVDSGGREGTTQRVYDWCGERLGRGIYAIKGDEGPNRKTWVKAKKVKGGARLFIVGVDQIKTTIMDSLGRNPTNAEGQPDRAAMRFSDSLAETWFEQITNETRRLKYVNNRPIIEFKPKRAGLAVEALDCSVYAYAVRDSLTFQAIDLHARSTRRRTPVSADTPAPPARTKRRTIAEIAKLQNGD